MKTNKEIFALHEDKMEKLDGLLELQKQNDKEIGALEEQLRKLKERAIELQDEVNSASEPIVQALREDGFSATRAKAVMEGHRLGFTRDQIDILLSDELSSSRVKALVSVIQHKKFYRSLPDDEIMEVARICPEVEDIDTVVGLLSQCRYKREVLKMLKSTTATKLRTRVIMYALQCRYKPEFIERIVNLHLNDDQFACVFGIFGGYVNPPKIVYNGTEISLGILPLASRAPLHRDEDNRLTEDGINLIANKDLTPGLIGVLRIGLLSGMDLEKAAEYAQPGVDPQKAHDAFVEYLAANKPVTGTRP